MEQQQTTLFNFKTFRSPDRIDENKKDKYFIRHPNLAASAFSQVEFTSVDGATLSLDDLISSLHPAASYKVFLTTYPDFYRFL